MKKLNIKKRIIVVQINDILVGIMVEVVKDVVGVNEDNIEEISENRQGLSQEYINGVFSFNNDLVIVMNIKEILFGQKDDKEEV